MVGVAIRVLNKSDVPLLMEIEKASPALYPWSESSFLSEFENNITRGYGIEDLSGKLCGFLICHVVFDELDVVNIAVSKVNCGYGRRLMSRMISDFKLCAGKLITLEVRENNMPARHLYESLGFKQVNVRRGYYPNELAILMNLEL